MPKVSGKKFPYTKKGEKDAKKMAKKTGKKVTMSKGGKTALQEMFDMEQSGKKEKKVSKKKSKK